MAELDYAFLAEFAKVERGLLNCFGASYTHVFIPKLPSTHSLNVAGRIRADVGEDPSLSIIASSPSNQYEITFGMVPSGLKEVRSYNGKIGILFAASGPIPIVEMGLYRIAIDLDGKRVRNLAFEVEVESPSL
ncbi:MAG: hypothetical protein WDO06_01065 [Actinomycetota bacterium]